MCAINKNSRYHTTLNFDGEMNFAVLPFQLRYCNLATSMYQSQVQQIYIECSCVHVAVKHNL